jgi:hypothetical protein
MTSYKKLYEESREEIAGLEKKIDELISVDGMVDALTDQDARDALLSFADRAKNRAELSLLLRALSKIKD